MPVTQWTAVSDRVKTRQMRRVFDSDVVQLLDQEFAQRGFRHADFIAVPVLSHFNRSTL